MNPIRFCLPLFAVLFFMMALVLPLEAYSREVKNMSVEVGEGESVWDATRSLARRLSLKDSTFFKAWDESYTIIRGHKVPIYEIDWVDAGTKVFWNDAQRLFEVDLIGTGTIRDFQAFIAQNKDSWGKNGEEVTLAAISPVKQEKGGSAPLENAKSPMLATAPKQRKDTIASEKKENILPAPPAPGPAHKKNTSRFLFDPDVEIGGLILDQTQTSLGYTFFQHFTSYWQGDENDPFVITVIEQSSARAGVRVFVKVNEVVVHHSFLRARGQNFDEIAKQGVNDTQKYINERWKGT